MLASLYYLFGNTENYDHITGTMIGITLCLIGLITTFTIYSVYLVDPSLNKNLKKKNELLKSIIIAGFTLTLLFSIFIGFSINRYNFCQVNQEVCLADYAFSPFS
uniref:Uncharacterized protein n=1 Tax=viral metagenome TaxID=1070528 RepID=A0A6C0H134_9ZZZZ